MYSTKSGQRNIRVDTALLSHLQSPTNWRGGRYPLCDVVLVRKKSYGISILLFLPKLRALETELNNCRCLNILEQLLFYLKQFSMQCILCQRDVIGLVFVYPESRCFTFACCCLWAEPYLNPNKQKRDPSKRMFELLFGKLFSAVLLLWHQTFYCQVHLGTYVHVFDLWHSKFRDEKFSTEIHLEYFCFSDMYL